MKMTCAQANAITARPAPTPMSCQSGTEGTSELHTKLIAEALLGLRRS